MLVAVSLKAYLGLAETLAWCRGLVSLRDGAGSSGSADIAVFPAMTALAAVASELRGRGIDWGAQDIAGDEHGAQTGETPGRLLAELGCRYAEIGHAERRARGESDEIVARKTALALDFGITPFICIGEPERHDASDAIAWCTAQLEQAIAVAAGRPIVVAYEPVWAIGAPQPAPADAVRPIADGIRSVLAAKGADARLVYGGAAGPGTLTDLAGHVDGIFLGRFAHDLNNVSAILSEIDALDAHNTHERAS